MQIGFLKSIFGGSFSKKFYISYLYTSNVFRKSSKTLRVCPASRTPKFHKINWGYKSKFSTSFLTKKKTLKAINKNDFNLIIYCHVNFVFSKTIFFLFSSMMDYAINILCVCLICFKRDYKQINKHHHLYRIKKRPY